MLLSTKKLNLKIAARKLLCKFVGPFEVLAPPEHATNPNVLWLKTPRQFKIHMPVNVKDIKRYHRRDDDVGGPPEQMPEPIVIDGEDCYEVEAVLAERTHGRTRQRQVLVKWTGLDLLSATWVPMGNIPQWALDEFRGLQKDDGDDEDSSVKLQSPKIDRICVTVVAYLVGSGALEDVIRVVRVAELTLIEP